MAVTTASFAHALRRHRLIVRDMRAALVKHPTRRPQLRDPDSIRGVVLHHSAMEGGDVDALHSIARYHTSPGSHLSAAGAPTIAYTLAIGGEGEVYLCNDLGVVTWSQGMKASAPGYRPRSNQDWLGCLVLGNFRSPSNPAGGEPTLRQMHSALTIMVAAQSCWGWGPEGVEGHFRFGKPACPGDTLAAMVSAARSHVIDLGATRGRQQALTVVGYPLAVDGSWGPMSRDALRKFQGDHGLEPDGTWGPRTEDAMRVALREVSSG